MTEEIKFNDKQIEILKELNSRWKNGSIIIALIMNVFEILHLGRDLERILALPTFRDYSNPRTSITECIIRNSMVPEVHEYVQRNEDRILDAFESFPLIPNIVKRSGFQSCTFTLRDQSLIRFNCNRRGIERAQLKELFEKTKARNIFNINLRTMRVLHYKPESIMIKPFGKALVTHNDLDGIGSAVLALFNNMGFDRIYTVGYDHRTSNFVQELKTYDEVIVTDISFGDLTLPNMKTFDHHGDLDDKHCGTWQFYYNCVPKEKHTKSQDKFVHLVDVYDNWKTSDPLFHSACLLNGFFLALTGSRCKARIQFQTINDSIWRDIFHQLIIMLRTPSFKLDDVQRAKANEFQSKINNEILSIKASYGVARSGNLSYMVFQWPKTDGSLVAHRLMEELNLDFVVMPYQGGNKCSLRSREMNLFQIENFQGHAHAGVAQWADVQRFVDGFH